MGQKDSTLPYGQTKDKAKPERDAPGKTVAQPLGAPRPPAPRPEQTGRNTLAAGSGAITEVAQAAAAVEAPDASASGKWQMPPPSSAPPAGDSAPPASGRWHPVDKAPASSAPGKKDHSPPPVSTGNGVILTVGWIEQILDLSLGHEIEIQVAGLGRNFKVELSERAIVDVLASLAAYVRENMPNGGTLTMQAAHIELKEPGFAKKLDLPFGRYVFLGLSHIAKPGGASSSGVFREPAHARRGLGTVMKMIKGHNGSVAINESEGRVMGFSIYLPAPKD